MRTPVYTCEQAQEYLADAHAARKRTLEAIEYAIENSRNSQRMVKREHLSSIDADIAKWEQVCSLVCNLDNPIDIKQGLPTR